MKKLAGAFLAFGILASACGDDGTSPGTPAPGGAGAAGDGTGATDSSAGQGPVTKGGSGGSSGSSETPGGEGGTRSPPAGQGGNASGGEPDQSVSLGGAFEEVHGDPPIDPDCGDYSEHNDRSNNYASLGAELTGITLDKTAVTICGRLDAYHFEPSSTDSGTVDVDYFRVNVAGDADYQVSIEFPEDAPPADVTEIFNDPGYSNSGTGIVNGKRGAEWVSLYEGNSWLAVASTSATPLEHSIPYKLHIRKDSPLSRCTTVAPGAASQNYSEAKDGVANNGNDVVHYVFDAPQTPTAASDDAPEPSAIVLNVGDHSLIRGSSALVDYGDDYDDADMYEFKSGTSEVLSLRLDWAPNKGTDLDLWLFNADDLTFRYLERQINSLTQGPELVTALVKPSTTYWLYVVGGSDSEDGGLPAAYGVTMCGEKFKF